MKPRDKIKVLGVRSLSDKELLAVILGSGSKKRSVYSLARQISQIINNGDSSAEWLYKRICRIKGIGDAKALSVISAVELGKRLFQNPRAQINCTKDVWLLTKDIGSKRQECVFVIYLDSRKQFIAKREIALGCTNCAAIDVKLILFWAFRLSAFAFVLVHNHPSGECKPSKEDYLTTEKVREVAFLLELDFCDHVIVTKWDYRSII
ncbi:DNA repair protein RadC [Candidatus Dojkabacteria bacterium]|nr:DNA repair protein RadC [Candidatus Dojkabacteria bacterium]